jgi:hypothetical protein
MYHHFPGWASISYPFPGDSVRSQLLQQKGVKLSSFGTFTLSNSGDPVFIISGDLATHFNLKQVSNTKFISKWLSYLILS